MWQSSDGIVPSAESKHNLCSKSLLNNLVKSCHIGSANSSSLDQQSNSSSLESIESFALDGNQALSTSCSEDSFEMSGTTLKPITKNSSQLSLHSLNLTSSFLGAEGDRHQEPFGCNNSDQMSRDSLEPYDLHSSLEKSNLHENADFPTNNSFALTNYYLERSDEPNNVRKISQDESIINSIMNRDETATAVSCPCVKAIQLDKNSLREYIDKELDNLDTCLPQLDFNKLEEKLNCAAKERIVAERKLLGEQVRRRLALQLDQYTAGAAPRVYMRPSKSNLGFRLQTAMNLQICYINDLKDEEDDDEESSDDDFSVPKSKSAPNLRTSVIDGSNLNASELRQAVSAINAYENECQDVKFLLACSNSAYRAKFLVNNRCLRRSVEEKRKVLEEETKMMLIKAKQAAKMQMEIEKLNTDRFTTIVPPKVSRLQLSKMTHRQLIEISEKISKRINEENAELMRLLIEKDSLYMQQDSMLVDIEDMIQHESNSESLNLPDFLRIRATPPVAMFKFRIFNG
ncbi:Schwannomin-interacting protein 1 [Dirofilaria immitis]|nr:Schwannomin-interacting protein 1 [Dirofilaria immitis]